MSEAALFEAQRARLIRLAYRMLGSLAEAEDVAQDAWLRWSAADREAIDAPAAWLTRTVTRLCLDRLGSARARRETYVGPWLPEPLIEAAWSDPLERAEEVSVAFLLALQRLSPLERAAFLLHDVFETDHATLAGVLGRSEAACRQLVSRARSHVKEGRPRFEVAPDQAEKLARAFMAAAASGDTAAMTALLAEDCVLISDGGGKRSAALRPLVGPEDIVRLITGLAWRRPDRVGEIVRPARINGAPGLVLRDAEGVQTIAFEPGPDGRLAAIYIVRNPDKLRGVATLPG